MSDKIINISWCTECPYHMTLGAEINNQIYRCELNDMEIPIDVQNDNKQFPDFCLLPDYPQKEEKK